MDWTYVYSHIQFMGTASIPNYPGAGNVSQAQQDEIIGWIHNIYFGSLTGKSLIENAITNSGVIRIAEAGDNDTHGPAYVVTGPVGGQPLMMLLNNTHMSDELAFNTNGNIVALSPEHIIAHELTHYAYHTNDPDYQNTALKNGRDFDYRGRQVNMENTVGGELGQSDEERASYEGAGLRGQPLMSHFDANKHYTDDQHIDFVRISAVEPGANADFDFSARTDNASILAFTFDGDDALHGGGGTEWAYLGKGDDQAQGGGGNDHLFGQDGDDDLSGDAGDDVLVGGSGADSLTGGDGNDTLLGGGGLDTLLGGNGDDLLAPGNETGQTTLQGGAGNDVFNISATSLESFHPSGVDYVISDGEDGDRIVYNGYELGAGTWTALDWETVAPGVEVYPSQDMDSVTGSIYQWNDDHSLSIILPDNQVVLIPNWTNGMFGITLEASAPGQPPAGTQPSDWPRTNIAEDGTVADFDYISERVIARTVHGPIDDPYVLFA